MPKSIDRCRICSNPDLRPIIHLGEQALTGLFPVDAAQKGLTHGPLELIRCSGQGDTCGLVQLRHSYDMAEMYGEQYGYRSSLNRSMVEHLRQKVADLLKLVTVGAGDIVLDIGSNDGTLLSSYPQGEATLVGMDPTIAKFRKYYRPDIRPVADFFSAARFQQEVGSGRSARIVTSIAMFYDLEDPLAFVKQVADILDPQDGIWHFEQSYLPSMLATTAYDTICHEHVEYYALRQIKWLTDRAGLKIIDVALNDINGGSFAITVAHEASRHQPRPGVAEAFAREAALGLLTASPYEAFTLRVCAHRDQLKSLLARLKQQGAKVLGYGASTKGNVILQYCNLGPDDLTAIAEVNADKFGCFTPGTRIPICSEPDAKRLKPDYFLVLPWHFRSNVVQREAQYLAEGGRLIFPLPELQVVSSDGKVERVAHA